MAKNAFWANVLAGGGAAALDLIPGIKLQDLDFACVVTADTLYPMVMDVDDGGAEDSPNKIAPDTDAGDKMWELLAIRAAGITVPNTGLHILDTDASHDLIIKPGSDLGADRTLTITTGDADRTLDLAENLKVLDGQDIELHASGGEKAQLAIDTQNAERTLDMSENLTVANGYNVTLQALGQANSLILNEGLTIGDGNSGTITYKQASKSLNVEDDNLIPGTGWPTTPGVTISFGGTRTVTVTDGGSAFYYIRGTKYILGGNKTVQIDDTEGLWYIYFSGATLTASQTPWDIVSDDKALVAYVYWDATNDVEIFLGYELHSYWMDNETHARLHFAGGASWEEGLLVADTGSETVNVSAGDFFDEDIEIEITDGAGSALFEQVLSPAELPIYYRSGASDWRIYETTDKGNATDLGYVTGGDLYYNKLNGTWASAAVSSAKHIAMYVVATNEQTEPIALIMGQREDTTLADSKENNIFSFLDLTGLPFEEMIVLARLILKESGSGLYYTLEDIVDLRITNITGNVTSPLISDHGGLAGLGDDDHQQYILHSLFDADTFLYATDNNTPVATSPANVMAALSGHAAAAFSLNEQNLTNVGTIGSDSITLVANESITLSGTGTITSGSGGFVVGNAAMSEVDLEKLDGITNGTAAANKAVVLDASKNIATLGTVSCGVVTQSGTTLANTYSDLAHHDRHDPNNGADALDCAAAAEISVVVAASEGSAHEFARSDHVHAIVHAITDNHIVTIDGTTNQPVNTDYAKFTASGLEGRSYAQVLSDIGAQASDATLTAFASLLTAANKIPYATGEDTGGELDLAITVGDPGSDTTLVSEQGIREALDSYSTTLAGLTDTTITGPADLDLLQYDNGSSKWVDRTFVEAGVAANTFTAINALIGAADAAVDFNSQYATSLQNIPDLASKGAGYWFDGVNDAIQTANYAMEANADLSLLLCIKTNTTNDQGVMEVGNTYVGIGLDGGYLCSQSYDGAGHSPISTLPVSADIWHTVANVYTNGEVIFYVDGKSGGAAVSAPNQAHTGAIRVGDGYVTAANVFFDGEISKALVFNLALTATEVKALSSGAPVPYKYIGASQTNVFSTGDMETDPATEFADILDFCALANEAGEVHSGSQSLKVTGDGTAVDHYAADLVTVEPGKAYRFAGWFKSSAATNNAVGYAIYDNTNSAWIIGRTTATDCVDWTEKMYEFVTPPDCTTIRVYVYTEAVANATGYFDDYSVTQIGCVLQLEQPNITSAKWYDSSGNDLDGTNSGAVAINLPDPDAHLIALGITSTITEINQLATMGATTISANQWAALGGIAETLTAAELNILDGVTGVTAAELSYIGDVTGLIQAQLDLKAAIASPTFTGTVTVPSTNFTVGTQVLTQTNLTDLLDGGDTTLHDHDGITENTTARHAAVTLNASATTGGMSLSTQEISNRAATNAQTGYATAAHITAIEANTTDSHASGSDDQTEADILTLLGLTSVEVDQVGNIAATTISAGQWGVLGGLAATLTSTELNYVDGVTSAIQTQLDARCLESVLGTSIGAGLLLDGAVLKASTGLQSLSGLTLTAGDIAIATGANAWNVLDAGATTKILVGGGAANPVWTTATGSDAPVRATSPTLVTPALGTPASGTLTSCTGLPAASVVAGSFVANMLASDHGTAATDQIINVAYGDGAAPAANTCTEGALYIKYVA